MNKILFAGLLLSSQSVLAADITGLITDSNNTPIANAKIEVHGQNGVFYTNDMGKFLIDTESFQTPLELHISAKGYQHFTLGQTADTDYQVALKTTALEYIDVYATPLHASTLESASPITVISDEALKYHHAPTLGETLKSQVGIHSTYFGPVSSSPIIRGLDGPRVLIAQNGLDVGDASRVGPDHVVSTDTSTVKQVEILRGPATLIFGNGAIGGVVNVVDNRVPTSNDFEADWQLSHNTVSAENEASFNLTTGADNFAFHIDGFKRDSDDYEIPANPESEELHEGESEEEHAEHEEEFNGTLENSASESEGINVGASYLLDNGYVGFSYGKLDKLYGIAGHSHGSHEEHEDESEEEHAEHAEHEEGSVQGDMAQERVQILSQLNVDSNWLTAINTKYGYTDYKHAEVEGDEIGTTFTNESHEFKTDLLLTEISDWHGALTFDYKTSDFEAIGAEAFTPASETKAFAVALLEEKHFGDFLIQLGARVESVELSTHTLTIEEEHHDDHEEEHHDEHDEHDEHEVEHHDEGFSETYQPISISAGILWDFAEGQNLGLSISRSERAPSASEVFAFGPHIGTGSFEVGALYELHQEDDETHFEIESHDLELETSNNIDLSYRKFDGDVGVIFNVFYNRIENYYYQSNTGLYREDEHEEHDEHEEEHHDEHEDEHHDEYEEQGLPVFLTQTADAELYGFEAQVVWKFAPQYTLTMQSDYIRGKLLDSGNLPRIPPARLGATFDYTSDNWDAKFEVRHNFKQDTLAEMETETDAYTMLNVSANYHFNLGEQDLSAYFKGRNITDEEARVHSSYLKSTTLLPGRGVTVGIRGSF